MPIQESIVCQRLSGDAIKNNDGLISASSCVAMTISKGE
jgi:hypothetical protein